MSVSEVGAPAGRVEDPGHLLRETTCGVSLLAKLDILRADAFNRIGKLGDAAMLSPAIDSLAPLDQNDSLALSLYLRELAEFHPASTGEAFAPLKYRRAAKEIADEITAEWKHLRSNPAAHGRETYP